MSNKSKFLTNRRLRRYKRKDTQDYLQLTFTAFLLIIFIGFAIRPSVTTAYKLAKKISAYKQLDKKLTNKITNIKTIRKQYKEVAPFLPLLDKTIPETPSDGYLLSTLTKVASKHHARVTNISFQRKHKDTSLSELAISFAITGRYVDITDTLKDFNNLLRIVDVTSVSIDPHSKLGQNEVTAALKASAYYYRKTQ